MFIFPSSAVPPPSPIMLERAGRNHKIFLNLKVSTISLSLTLWEQGNRIKQMKNTVSPVFASSVNTSLAITWNLICSLVSYNGWTLATSRRLLPQGSRPQTKTKERFLSRTSAAVSHYRSILPSRPCRHRILCGRPYLPLSIYGNTLMAFPCKWRCE